MRHLHTIAQICRAISSQLRHVSTIGEKLLKQQYLLHMSLQYGEHRPTIGWDRLASFGHPRKFQRVLCLGFVTASTSLNGGQPNFAPCLAVPLAGIPYIHFWGLLPLPGAKFTLHPSLACFYIGSVTAQHSSSVCTSAKLCGMWQGRELWNFHSSTYIPHSPHSSSLWQL